MRTPGAQAMDSGLSDAEVVANIRPLPVLLVDDEPQVLRALRRDLKDSGIEIMTARGPEEGLQQLGVGAFSAVVADLRMPNMDGIAFLREVRERAPASERLLLTAHADEEALERGINEASISVFLRKPWRRDVLIARLQAAQDQARLRTEHKVLQQRLEHRGQELTYLNELLQQRVDEGDRSLVHFRRRWDVALNTIVDPLIIVSEDYAIEGANRAAGELGAQDAAALEGQKCYASLFGRGSPCAECPIAKHGTEQQAGALTAPQHRPQHEASGEPEGAAEDSERHAAPVGHIPHIRHLTKRMFEARAYPLDDGSGASLCVYRDVTMALAGQIEKAAIQRHAAIGRLASGMAHEINNPLQGIITFVQLAAKPDVKPEKQSHYLDVIKQCALRCRDIVKALRSYSRTAGTSSKRPVDLGALARDTLLLFEGQKSDAVVRFEIVADETPQVRGNRGQLQQVLVNMVQNAIDAGEAGATVNVTLTPSSGGNDWVLAVEDCGPGVAADDREKIFDPFYTTKPEGVGSGMGLPISQTIARDHGGRLVATDRSDGAQGARFELQLPRQGSAVAGEDEGSVGSSSQHRSSAKAKAVAKAKTTLGAASETRHPIESTLGSTLGLAANEDREIPGPIPKLRGDATSHHTDPAGRTKTRIDESDQQTNDPNED